MTHPDPMELQHPPEHYQSDDGLYVDKIEIANGEYETVYLREINEDSYLLVGERADGSRYTLTLEQMPEKYIGLRPDGEDRRTIPDDLQDALFTLGFTPRPHVVNGFDNPLDE
jgi:hypothetical protein